MKQKSKLKTYLKLSLFLIMSTVAYMGFSSWNLERNILAIRNATFTVLTPVGMGTGVVVKSDESGSLLLTNKHICDGALQTPLELRKQSRAGADLPISTFVLLLAKSRNSTRPLVGQVMEMSDNTDLCVVHLMEKELDTVKLAKKAPKAKEKIFTHGNPMGMEDVTANGILGSRTVWHHMQYTMAKLSVRPGSSGSGTYNKNAELVGLISWGNFRDNIAGIVSYEHVKTFLERFGVE